MPTKPKRTQPESPYEPQGRDNFQTPNYATDLIVPVLKAAGVSWVWEPCCGEMKKIVNRLGERGFNAFGTDLIEGEEFNALTYIPAELMFDCVVTNPPYSIKTKIVQRFIQLGYPFAFLIPGDWCQWLIEAMNVYGCQMIVPTRRINYITPSGNQGKESSSMFHSVWLTRNLGLADRIMFVDLKLSDYENI